MVTFSVIFFIINITFTAIMLVYRNMAPVVACCNASPIFDPAKYPLDAVASFIAFLILLNVYLG